MGVHNRFLYLVDVALPHAKYCGKQLDLLGLFDGLADHL